MLVVTPTRELAQQIGEVCTAIAVSTHHRILTVVGACPMSRRSSELRHGVDVLIATPGRLIDLMEQQAVHLNDVGVLVLDEADRMLDMGFWPSMKKIVAATPAERQTLLFSATIDRSIQNSVGKLLRDPALVEIAHKGDTADTVDQYIVRVPQTLKPDLLRAVLKERGSKRVIVFARTAAAPTPPAAASSAPVSPPRPSTPTAARTSAAARSTTSPPAPPTSSWQPTCWPAASTWKRWTTWSTTTCPPSRKTTCTASAAPAGPARAGMPSPS